MGDRARLFAKTVLLVGSVVAVLLIAAACQRTVHYLPTPTSQSATDSVSYVFPSTPTPTTAATITTPTLGPTYSP